MEGISRVSMLSLPLLIPDPLFPLNFEKNIREYIATNYQTDPSDFDNAFCEIKSMRNVIVQNTVNIESICVMKRYYAQLMLIKALFPMEENDPLAVPFSWKEKSAEFYNSLTYNDINFEICCVLFNISAAHSILALCESRSNPDSIKVAFMHFQYAAWPLQHLKDNFYSTCYSFSSFDKIFLENYINLFLAQAQECLFEKTISDNRNPLLTSKILIKLTDFYRTILNNINNSKFSSTKKQKALCTISNTKLELYTALSSYYFGRHAEEEKNLSLRISYFTFALEHITLALKKAEKELMKEAVQFAYDVIFQIVENAKKENDFIYHERVVKIENLDNIEPLTLVKPISFDVSDPSVAGEDLFISILPSEVVKRISLYSEEKLNLKKKYLDKAQLKDKELETYLLSLQLEHLNLDRPIENVSLPDELLSSSAAFSAQPNAFPSLINKLDELLTASNEAEQKLLALSERICKIENLELAKDDGFRAIQTKINELISHHKKAQENNAELKKAIDVHYDNLKLLGMPLTQLTKEICGNFVNPMEHKEGVQLRKMLDKVDEMRLQRFQLLKKLESDLEYDDITKKALLEHNARTQDSFKKDIDKHNQILCLINQNLTAQENILKSLTEANANFADFRQQIIESNEKRALHSLTLVTAYRVFLDVVKKTDQALSFYTQLNMLISALSKGISLIEETEDKKQREIEKLMLEQQKQKENAKALAEFSFFNKNKSDSLMSNELTQNYHYNEDNSLKLDQKAKTQRPRLNDYMNYYRNKMAGNIDTIHSNLSINKNINLNLTNEKNNFIHSQLPTANFNTNQSIVNQNMVYITSEAERKGEQQNQNIFQPSIATYQQLTNHSHPVYSSKQLQSELVPNVNSTQQYLSVSNNEKQNNLCYVNNTNIQPQLHNNLVQQNQVVSTSLNNFNNQISPSFEKTNELQIQPQNFLTNQESILSSHLQAQLPICTNNLTTILPGIVNNNHSNNHLNLSHSQQNAYIAQLSQNLTNIPSTIIQSDTKNSNVLSSNNIIDSFSNVENKSQSSVLINKKNQLNSSQTSYSNLNNRSLNTNLANNSNFISPWHQNLSIVNPYASSFKNTGTSQIVVSQPYKTDFVHKPTNYSANVCPTSNTLDYSNQVNVTSCVVNQTTNDAMSLNTPLQKNLINQNQPSVISAENNLCNLEHQNIKNQNFKVVTTQEIKNQSECKNLTNKETKNITLKQVSGENVLNKNINTNVVVSLHQQRPAAAIIPLTRHMPNKISNAKNSIEPTNTLGIINVTSISHSDNTTCNNTSKLNVFSTTENKNNNCSKNEINLSNKQVDIVNKQNCSENNKLNEILDPNFFNLGEADKSRLEKRKIREEFRLHGLNAKLPELDKTDPLNTLDAHFWISK